MHDNLSRRDFFTTTKTACGAVALLGLGRSNAFGLDDSDAGTLVNGTTGPVSPEFPHQEDDIVREVVGAAHVRLDRVKELVTQRPALAKVSRDWGFGDWESALGAASHMGRSDIAEFLMEHGARPNLFTFAMLGKLDAVRSQIEAMPGVQRTHGPHGITLLQHARNRLRQKNLSAGDRANSKSMVSYLESLGDADIGATSLDITDEQKKIYLGRYTFGSTPEDVLTVGLDRRKNLSFKRGDQDSRRLHLVEAHAFAPSGAPTVRIRFEVKDGRAVALTVHDPIPLVRATCDGC